MGILNKLRSHIFKKENGAAVIVFVVALPVVISLFALAFDGARIMIKKNRLAHVLNEAGLAIAASGYNYKSGSDRAENKERNEWLLRRFIKLYLPDEDIHYANVTAVETVSADLMSATIRYDIAAQVEVRTILPLTGLPSFSPLLYLDNIGKVTKYNESRIVPTDFIFVMDFSGSMISKDSSLPGAPNRINMLKRVVKEIIELAFEQSDQTTIGLVPFDSGVPELVKKKGTLIGTDQVACSFVFTPKEDYKLDYKFWGKKNFVDTRIPVGEYSNAFVAVDFLQTEFYKRYLAYAAIAIDEGFNARFPTESSSKPEIDAQNLHKKEIIKKIQLLSEEEIMLKMVDKGFCRKNSGIYGANYKYSCDITPTDNDIFVSETHSKIDSEYADFRRISDFIRQTPNEYGSGLLYLELIDIPKTLQNMFDESSVISIPMNNAAEQDTRFFPFKSMCKSLGLLNNREWREEVEIDIALSLAGYDARSYLIELTGKDDKSRLDAFQKMVPGGETNSSAGLLRALPILAKGKNERKVIIVISDGEDTNKSVRNKFHENEKICDKIRTGMPFIDQFKNTGKTDIYFISVIPPNTVGGSGEQEDGKTRVEYWAENCTGVGKSVTADNTEDLKNQLITIMSASEESGVISID